MFVVANSKFETSSSNNTALFSNWGALQRSYIQDTSLGQLPLFLEKKSQHKALNPRNSK